LLRRAIENVVRNGVQYTREGTEVEVTLRCRSDAPPTRATVEVRDHGPGVPPAALGDIFQPFYRVADARDRHSGGTGLGLAITAQAIRLHGGQVQASNAPDGGLVVQIELPAK
jgi:two-component system sensor histidine kinase CpxA